MGSIGIISLTTRRNRRFFISAEHYPVVKVRSHRCGASRRVRRERRSSSSDPLVGDPPASAGRGTDQGRDGGPRWAGLTSIDCVSGRPEVFGYGTGRAGGGDEETRTPDPLLAKETLCQLSYVPVRLAVVMVGVSGLEPETSALSGQCSNQLS